MNNIILIGFMGCGKTTVGIRLSYKLRMTFLDTDKCIEQDSNQTISEIFARQGEEKFRDLETACLKKMVDTCHNQVISVGGGLPLREENRKLLRQLGTVIYLQITPESVYERLKDDTTRPLLQGENPFTKIQNLMEARKGFYKDAAQIIIDVNHKNMEEVLDEIVFKVEEMEK